MTKPVQLKEVLKLPSLNIDAASIKFTHVTLQSRNYVCVREESKKNVAIVNTETKQVVNLGVDVQSAIMNPVSNVIALRNSDDLLQIYNLDMRSKMKTTNLAGVEFWKWLDAKTIAIVTNKQVLHWGMDGDQSPVKIFDRAAAEGVVRIINYRASADMKWLILGGLTSAGGLPKGVLQVYSVDLKASQPTMDAPAACFASITLDTQTTKSNIFCFIKQGPDGMVLQMIQVGAPAGTAAFNKSTPMRFQGGDFPIGMLPDNKYGIIFVVSKMGFLFMFDIQSGKMIFGQQCSQNAMFAQVESEGSEESGIVCVDQTGSLKHFFVDRENIVPYICNTLNDKALGIALARRNNLPGAGGFFNQQFQSLMAADRHQEAMELAANSPQGNLRTTETLEALKAIPNGQGLLQYFQILLNKEGGLNKIESIELTRPVLNNGNQQGIERIRGWVNSQKLEPSEELGDMLKNKDLSLALAVYLRAQVPDKVIGCFLSLAAQQTDEAEAQKQLNHILEYAKRVNHNPDYSTLLGQLAGVNADRAKDFALLLINHPDGQKLDINATVEVFMRQNDVKNTTNILLRYLKPRGDKEEDGPLQTKLLEINLMHLPTIADTIMSSDDYKFTHYDKEKIAMLCERAQLYQRALEHYTDITDIKRVLTNSYMIKPAFLLEYFGRMTAENCLELLRDLLKFNLRQNIRLVVEVAKQWSDRLTSEKLIEMFEDFKAYDGLYYYLGGFVNTTEDSKMIFKYIEAATLVPKPQLKEVERVCRDNNHYDPVEVKDFLLSQNLKDPRPLIHVCDRNDFVDELTHYLYTNKMYVFIEAYVQRMNAKAAPAVIGALLDMNAEEDKIGDLLSSSAIPPPDDPTFVSRLVDVYEKRNRLKLLRPFLEKLVNEKSTDQGVHNGLMKIYVDINNNPKHHLENNKFYDSAVVGAYCESRNPHLSFTAYERAFKRSTPENPLPSCDQQLIEVTNKYEFFKDQARYLVQRQDESLWVGVLAEENPHRSKLIDQVIATALPESTNNDEVSRTVKAFVNANLPNELIEMLERLILHGANNFREIPTLQNILILTAIKADKSRVMNYLKQLRHYDSMGIAELACKEEYQLYEEAIYIYNEFKHYEQCIKVQIEKMNDIGGATEYAEKIDKPEVWSILASAMLQSGRVNEAIKSYLKADDAENYTEVLAAASQGEFFSELIDYIKMARKKVKDPTIDNELIYCFARTEEYGQMEEFITGTNVAKISDAGDRCFKEGLYHAAQVLFKHVNNNARLAICLVKLGKYQEAVNAAKAANAVPTWKEVCFACVESGEFRLAQHAGLNVIIYMDHLHDLVQFYERGCHFNELITLLEAGINLDNDQPGIYTQLGVCYCKYMPTKVMDHIKQYWQKLVIPTLLEACLSNLHYSEAVFLYSHYDQHDNAVNILMNYSAECWKHELFNETIKQVANNKIFYQGIKFYLEEHPLLLNDLCMSLNHKLDAARVVEIVKNCGGLPLIKKYLEHMQKESNNRIINDALNAMYIEEEDYASLRESIDNFEAFDKMDVAVALENHSLIEFRRISTHLFKLCGRWERSMEMSKKDCLWQDAMETCAQSKDSELGAELLKFFVDRGEKECFAAMLFTCYDQLKPDVVLEVAWRKGLMDFAMPFMIQSIRNFELRMDGIQGKLSAADDAVKAEQNEQKKVEDEQQQYDASYLSTNGIVNPMMAPLQLPTPGAAYGGYAPQGYGHQSGYGGY